MMQPVDMSQAGAKGPAVPAKPLAATKVGGISPGAPPVAPKAPGSTVHTAATPKATAPIAPKKGPPPLPPESSPNMAAATPPQEPMRPRFETSPGVGHTAPAETPRTPPTQSREEIQAMIRASVDSAVAAVLSETQRLVFGLERRIDELERRPAPAAVAPAPPIAQLAQHAMQPVVRAPPIAMVSAIPMSVSQAPVLDVKAIERDVHIEIDSALDGRKRKRRLVIMVVVFILLVFGGMFGMLAQSYSHQG
jgi:hypothetical protein